MKNKILFILIVITIITSISAVSATNNSTHATQSENYTIENNYEINSISTNSSNKFINNTDVYTSNKNSTSARYYVNNSNADKGNGSNSEPWNTLTQSELDEVTTNSTIYLSDGIYNMSDIIITKNITITGQNTNKTIINGANKGNSLFSLYGNLTLCNVTVTNYTTTSIDIHKHSHLNLNNIVFINHNSTSKGSIYSELSTVYIDNSKFINLTSTSGGAIYLFNSNMTLLNSEFINNSARLGGAILTINGTSDQDINTETDELAAYLVISNTRFINNTAIYDGGAIFDTYSGLTILSSNFTGNKGRRGGAIYSDDLRLEIESSVFINNTAASYGGVIYANQNNIILNSNNFTDNSAKYGDNMYSIYNTSSMLSNNNWYGSEPITYLINEENIADINITNVTFSNIKTIPSSYDLRDYGYVTSVKDQGNDGNCYAFAMLATLESCILKAMNITLDLSENNLKNIMAMFSEEGWKLLPGDGGLDDMSIGYLVNWIGPVLESDDEYDTNSYVSPLLKSILHVTNVYGVPTRTNSTDNDEVKTAIMKYGAVYTGIYSGSIRHGYSTTTYINHAVTIVGWDDNYSRYNFDNIPPGDGAFIVKNSWGTSSGDEGYYYVSYYDSSILNSCDDFYGVGGITFILNDTTNYNRIYQYDLSGLSYWYEIEDTNTYTYSNEFTSSGNDLISSFGTYVFSSDYNYIANIYVNNELQETQSGKFSHTCYETIKLNKQIPVNTNDTIKIELRLTSNDTVIYIPTTIDAYSRLAIPTEKSLIGNTSYSDAVVSLKLYTSPLISDYKLNIPTNTTANAYNNKTDTSINITVVDENNTCVTEGIMTIKINNDTYAIVTIEDGHANITIPNKEFYAGINNITLTYSDNHYNYSSSNVTVTNTVYKDTITTATVDDNGQNTTFLITVKDEDNLNISSGTITVKVNNQTYSNVSVRNGVTNLTISNKNLNVGKNNVTFTYTNTYYYSSNTILNFTVSKPVHMTVEYVNFTVNYNVITVKLLDEFDDNVADGIVTIKINSNSYSSDVRDSMTSIRIPVTEFNKGNNLLLISYNSSTLPYNSSDLTYYVNGSEYGYVYYIAANGSSSNNGRTNQTPWTYTYAFDQMKSGAYNNSIVYITAGNYNITSTATLSNGLNLKIIGYSNTILNGNNKAIYCFNIQNGQISIINLTFQKFTSSPIINRADNTTISGNTFINNKGTNGGAINLWNTRNTLIINNIFQNNTASYGGAIYNRGNNTIIRNNTFTKNNSTLSSGAVYNLGINILISGNQYTNNTAKTLGGAISNWDTSNITIIGNKFSGNKANYGGAVYYRGSTLKLDNNSLTGNTGLVSGGAVFVIGTSNNVTNNNFTTNLAKNGAGINNLGTNTIIIGNIITYNNATSLGGAISNWNAIKTTINNNTISSNRAQYGAVYLRGSNITVQSNTISNNKASYSGAAIFNIGTNNIITRNTIRSNNASNFGGAINNWNSVNTTITYNNITYNRASYGGGIYNRAINTRITGNVISYNSANYGGAIYDSKSNTTTMSSNTITNNPTTTGSQTVTN